MAQAKKVPKYCRHARGSAFVKLNGKAIYLGKYGTDESRKKYRRLLDQIESKVEVSAADVASPESRTVVRLIKLYLDYAAGYYVDAGGNQTGEYASMAFALVDVDLVIGDELCGKVGPSSLSRLQTHLIQKGHCRTFINKTISRVKRMFKWACAAEHCPAEVYHRLACVEPLRKGRTKARESKKVRPVPREVFDATLPWMSPVVADMARIQYLCGMRPSEMCRMRSADIDRSGDIWLYRPATHKNDWRGHQRTVAIPVVAQLVLKPYLDRDPQAWTFSPRDAEKVRNDARRPAAADGARKTKRYPSEIKRLAEQKAAREDTAFTRLRHAYDATSYRRAVTYAIKKAARKGTTIPKWFPYQLRHGVATEVAKALGEAAAQRWLGHESLDTTSIYLEKNVGELIATARLLDRHWAKVESPAAGGSSAGSVSQSSSAPEKHHEQN